LHCTFGAYPYVVLKFKCFRKYFSLTWNGLQCGAGEGWRRSFGPIIGELKKCVESRRKGISYKQYREGRLTGLIPSWLRSAF
jgi:hypothetical protein